MSENDNKAEGPVSPSQEDRSAWTVPQWMSYARAGNKDLQGGNFAGAYLCDYRPFGGFNQTHTHLNFRGADLRGANFSGTHGWADFRDADLRDANFDGARILEFELSSARLSGATFNGAIAENKKLIQPAIADKNANFAGATYHMGDDDNMVYVTVPPCGCVILDTSILDWCEACQNDLDKIEEAQDYQKITDMIKFIMRSIEQAL